MYVHAIVCKYLPFEIYTGLHVNVYILKYTLDYMYIYSIVIHLYGCLLRRFK